MMTMTMTMMAATYMIVLTTPTTIEAFQQNLPSLPRLPRLPDSLPRIPDSLPRPPTQMMPPFLQRQQQQQEEEQEQQKSTASTAPTTSQQMMAVESSNDSSQQQYFYVPSASSLESITTTPSSAIIPSSSGWMPASSNRDSALTRSAIDAAADSYRGTGCLAIAKGGKLLGSSGDIDTGGRFTWSVAKSLVGTLVGALDMDVRRPASAYGFRGRRDDMSVASFMAMNTSGSFSYSTGIVGDVASMALDAAGVRKIARTRPPGSLNRVLTENLYNKIGMRSTRAMDNGGSAITSSCSDLLRLALLWTRRGQWGSTTVFTQEYARLATTSAPSNAGYGKSTTKHQNKQKKTITNNPTQVFFCT